MSRIPVECRGYLLPERRGKMVQQAGAEFATGNLDEYTRYFNYLRTLADFTAMASIVAVQVIGCFEENLEKFRVALVNLNLNRKSCWINSRRK